MDVSRWASILSDFYLKSNSIPGANIYIYISEPQDSPFADLVEQDIDDCLLEEDSIADELELDEDILLEQRASSSDGDNTDFEDDDEDDDADEGEDKLEWSDVKEYWGMTKSEIGVCLYAQVYHRTQVQLPKLVWWLHPFTNALQTTMQCGSSRFCKYMTDAC